MQIKSMLAILGIVLFVSFKVYSATHYIRIYEHPDFKGLHSTLNQSETDLRKIRFNDIVSSIKLSQGTRIRICVDLNFTGQKRIITRSISNLKEIGLNDRITSIEFLTGNDGIHAKIFSKKKYRGLYSTIVSRESDLSNIRFNDIASSIKLSPGTSAIIYAHPEFKGPSRVLIESTTDLGDPALGLNKRVSSIRLMRYPNLVPELKGFVPGSRSQWWGMYDYNPPVENVLSAIKRIPQKCEPLRFYAPKADVKFFTPFRKKWRHWQGMQRLMTQEGRYFVLSKSSHSGQKGEIKIVKMRDGNKGKPMNFHPKFGQVKKTIEIPFRHRHIGGMQAVGNILAAGTENDPQGKDSTGDWSSRILFYDLKNPESPIYLSHLTLDTTPVTPGKAGVVAITKLKNGKYLLAVCGEGARQVHFYISSTTNLREKRTFFYWLTTSSMYKKVTFWDGLNNMNFVTDQNGTLYLVTFEAYGRKTSRKTSDYIVVYEVRKSDNGIYLRYKDKRNLYSNYDCCFKTACALYVLPNCKDIAIYATEYGKSGKNSSVRTCQWCTY